MTVRDKIQKEACEAIINNKFQGIIDVSPRVGKSRILIMTLRKLKKKVPILITYPTNNIKESWEEELEKWNYDDDHITFINQRSLHTLSKKELNEYSVIVSDECHSLSPAQLSHLMSFKGQVLGLSGSINKTTKDRLEAFLGLVTIYQYTVSEAVEDEIISDYRIKIITLPLNSKIKYIDAGSKKKPFKTTEEAHYKYLTRQFVQASSWEAENNKLALKDREPSKEGWIKSLIGTRARAIYSYKSKIELCKKLLTKLEGKVLVFTGLTDNDICAHKYDSKTEEDNLTLFKEGKIKQIQVVEQVSMGQTIPGLKQGVFHQLKSNSELMLQKALRMCNYEDGIPATIYILCYENTNDEKWVKKAVAMLDPDKIEYLHYKNI